MMSSYEVQVSPTVLVLGEDGEELHRLEGASEEVVGKVGATVDRLIAIGSTSGWALSNVVDDQLHRRATAVTGALLIGIGLYLIWLA